MIKSKNTVLRRLGIAVALPLAVIALSSCGASNSSNTTATTGTTSTTAPEPTATNTTAATTTTPVTGAAADERIAREAQLKLADLPSGWEQEEQTDSSRGYEAELECPDLDAAKRSATALQTSPWFENESKTVSSVALVYPDVTDARRAFDKWTSASTRTCISQNLTLLYEGQKEEALSLGSATSAEVSIAPIGDERASGRITIPISEEGLTVKAHIDLVFVRTGRALTGIVSFAVPSPLDEALRFRLAKKVNDRLASALKRQS